MSESNVKRFRVYAKDDPNHPGEVIEHPDGNFVYAADYDRCRVRGVVWIVFDAFGFVALERCPKKARVLGVGEWFLPGGKIEGTETPEQALHREIGEEWGDVVIASVRPLPIVEGSKVPPDGDTEPFLMRPFVVRIAGKIPDRCSEGTEIGWFHVDDILDGSPVPQVRMMVAGALEVSHAT